MLYKEFIELFPSPYPKDSSVDTRSIYAYLNYNETNSSGGLRLPECQRPLCWAEAQYKAYLQHIVASPMSCGEFITMWDKSTDTFYLLDGQHRYEAMRRFFNNEMSVTGSDGEEYYAKDLYSLKGRLMGSLREIVVDVYDEKLAASIYNSHNYTGVNH